MREVETATRISHYKGILCCALEKRRLDVSLSLKEEREVTNGDCDSYLWKRQRESGAI